MKNILITTIILALTNVVTFAQNFAPVGATWYYSAHANGACSGNCEYVKIEATKDTLIGNKLCSKLEESYFKMNGDVKKSAPLFIFESNDTVYYKAIVGEIFLPLFIFSGKVGDTISLFIPDFTTSEDISYQLRIDSVGQMLVNNKMLKQVFTKPIESNQPQFWGGGSLIERIGSPYWFYPAIGIIPEGVGPIRCFTDNQIDTNFQEVKCDHLVLISINEQPPTNDLFVYPNPVKDFITIESEQKIENISIIDASGKKLTTSENRKIDLSPFNDGLLMIKILLDNGSIIEKKIIKNAR